MKRSGWMIFFAACFTLMFVSSYCTYYTNDDMLWILNFFKSSPDVKSFEPTWLSLWTTPDVFENAATRSFLFWRNFNGRFFSNFCDGIAAGMTRAEWALLNSAIMCLLPWLILKIAHIGYKWLPLLFVVCVSFLFQNEVVLWRCGSANYLWPMIWVMSGALIFFRLSHGFDKRMLHIAAPLAIYAYFAGGA